MTYSNPRVTVLREAADREACQRSLIAAGIRLPLAHHAEWALARRGAQVLSVGLRGSDGGWAGAFSLQAVASRAVPGYRILRAERFGEALPQTQWVSAVEALALLARSESACCA